MDKFSVTTIEKIGYYVYRLIDPRNGETFYVGKGKNNRVFDHVAWAKKGLDFYKLKNGEDDEQSLKIKRITNKKRIITGAMYKRSLFFTLKI